MQNSIWKFLGMLSCVLFLMTTFITLPAFGLGGTSRPQFVGPGVTGSSLQQMRKPIYQKKDTTATIVTIMQSKGGTYNSSDQNNLYIGQVHKVWSKNKFNFMAGASGYSGKYEHNYVFIPREMTYFGGGVSGSAEVVRRGRFVDWHLGPQVSFLYEEGKLHDFLDNPERYVDTTIKWKVDILKTHSGKFYPSTGFTAGCVIKPYRSMFFALSGGIGHTGSNSCSFGNLSAGYGAFAVHYTIMNNSEIFKVSGKTLGLSIALPGIRQNADESPP